MHLACGAVDSNGRAALVGGTFPAKHIYSTSPTTLILPRHPGSSEERTPRQQSETEVGDLTPITVHGPTPPKEVRPVIGVELVYDIREVKPSLLT
ncbi:hypothetical protein AVEN_201022-1 [Araneus ventricosus]|uniref:Uncharacterized protein n=1 Tax=Araneus ventricosus TaxID=182803 RepID=A0A4Y2L055_ARAVE|nr:hypothetical protein AVEN_201022-1 [Araneus ventricosus]